MKLILGFLASLFLVTTLSANCGKCDMKGMQKESTGKSCKMHNNKDMKKSSCKKENCDHKKCEMKKDKSGDKMKKGHCDMKNHKDMKKDAKKCGCGMTVESCKKMMPHCEFRDKAEKKENE